MRSGLILGMLGVAVTRAMTLEREAAEISAGVGGSELVMAALWGWWSMAMAFARAATAMLAKAAANRIVEVLGSDVVYIGGETGIVASCDGRRERRPELTK